MRKLANSTWTETVKKSLKTAIFQFYKLNSHKGKEYVDKNFNNCGLHKATVYRWLEKFEKNGNCDIVIKMFENLKAKVHKANKSGLTSLLKM